ncbi:hypothetical protein HAX54_022314, partial [Datura stramonium]|nr:hypothetical protein [Datura stramonium]
MGIQRNLVQLLIKRLNKVMVKILSSSSANGDGPDPITPDGDGPAPASANIYDPDRAAADSDGPNLGLVGSDFIDEKGTNYSIDDSVDSEGGLVGYDDENYGKISLDGRLGGDDPYYPSLHDDSFEIYEEECCDEDEDVESGRINVARRTNVRRERSNVLKDIMGDHIVEFGRILDYKNELLRTNPESTCVVKLGEPNAFGKPDDSELGDGGDITLITDMQKYLLLVKEEGAGEAQAHTKGQKVVGMGVFQAENAFKALN